MNKLYIWIDGKNFDPEKFNKKPEVKGTIGTRKRLNNGIVEDGEKYWMSEVLEISSAHPEDSLEDFVASLKSILKDVEAERIVAEVVYEYKKADEVKGFFISQKAIALLSEIGASLDIDVIKI